jgi:hypothetical protein
MTVQTTYSMEPAIAVAGQIEDRQGAYIVSRSLETVTGLDAGVFCSKGASANQCKAIAAAGDVDADVLGVSVYRPIKMPVSATARFAETETVPIIRRGRVWVKVQGDVADDSPVFVVHENAGGNAGQIRADVGAGDNEATAFVAARVVRGGSAGGVALIEINLP